MSGSKSQKSLSRCEICNRMIEVGSGPRLHRCADHKEQMALFPLSAMGGRRRKSRGGR